jgi:hypothetical protein
MRMTGRQIGVDPHPKGHLNRCLFFVPRGYAINKNTQENPRCFAIAMFLVRKDAGEGLEPPTFGL